MEHLINATPVLSHAPAAEPALQTGCALEGSLPPLPLRLSVDTALPYRTGHGRTSYHVGICRLRLFVPTREPVSALSPAVALVTEICDQNGLSVTNGIEAIAAQVCRIHGLKPDNTVLIEHYDDRESGWADRLTDRVDGEKFSCIVFEEKRDLKARPDNRQAEFPLRHPQWHRLSKEAVEALIGSPLP